MEAAAWIGVGVSLVAAALTLVAVWYAQASAKAAREAVVLAHEIRTGEHLGRLARAVSDVMVTRNREAGADSMADYFDREGPKRRWIAPYTPEERDRLRRVAEDASRAYDRACQELRLALAGGPDHLKPESRNLLRATLGDEEHGRSRDFDPRDLDAIIDEIAAAQNRLAAGRARVAGS